MDVHFTVPEFAQMLRAVSARVNEVRGNECADFFLDELFHWMEMNKDPAILQEVLDAMAGAVAEEPDAEAVAAPQAQTGGRRRRRTRRRGQGRR